MRSAFLEKLASIPREVRSVRESLVQPPVRGTSSQAMGRDVEGFNQSIRGRNFNHPVRQRAVMECARLIADVKHGRRPVWHLQEAMTTADFPLLYGDLMYTQMIGQYGTYPVSYPAYFNIRDFQDLRKMNFYGFDGGVNALDQPLKEREPYPELTFTETSKTLQIQKYGKRYSITLEMILNSRLDVWQQQPYAMAEGARRGEELLATKQMFDANGPHAGFFSVANKNIITGNPPLTFENFQKGITQLSTQTDAHNEPIIVSGFTLVIGPALEVIANNIKNATEVWLTQSPATPTLQMHMANWLASGFNIAINRYIKRVVTSGTKADTSWVVVANTGNGLNRAAFEFGFLTGRRNPELFVKDPDASRVGGGPIDPTDGNFDHDVIDYKVRHFFGAAQGDPSMAVGSAGQ